MKDEFLPIGTVVLLKGASKRLMITGFCAKPSNDPKNVYDYCGCLYPEGVINSNETPIFNHDQIDKIICMGFSDTEEKEFKEKLVDAIQKGES